MKTNLFLLSSRCRWLPPFLFLAAVCVAPIHAQLVSPTITDVRIEDTNVVVTAQVPAGIRRVTLEQQGVVVEMINRFIAWQAEGGRVTEGQEIRIAGLPGGMTCHHRGSVDDPQFNNTHLEICWPGTYSF